MNRHREGPIARQIEEQTAEIPSDAFLWAAGGAAAVSFLLQLAGRQKTSNFIAAWTPTILICGVYNKLVKLAGHDAVDGVHGEGGNEEQGRASRRRNASADSNEED